MASATNFGWDLVLGSVKADIQGPNDVLVAFVHWKLLSRGLRVAGLGEHFTAGEDTTLSELLPDEWNKDQSSYVLRYRMAGKEADKYVLRALAADGDLVVSLIRFADEVVHTWTAVVSDSVDGKTLKDKELLSKALEEKLLKPMFDKKEEEEKKKEEKKDDRPANPERDVDHDPLRIGPPRHPHHGVIPPHPLGPGGLGGSDLDPFGVGGGGGMIFDPRGGRGGGRGGMPRIDPPYPGVPDDPFFPGGGRGGGRGGGGGGRFGDDFGPPGFGNSFM